MIYPNSCWASCVGRDGATYQASDTDGGTESRRQRSRKKRLA